MKIVTRCLVCGNEIVEDTDGSNGLAVIMQLCEGPCSEHPLAAFFEALNGNDDPDSEDEVWG